jgi:hypothetical protein
MPLEYVVLASDPSPEDHHKGVFSGKSYHSRNHMPTREKSCGTSDTWRVAYLEEG